MDRDLKKSISKEVERAEFAFRLKDGNTVLISREDCVDMAKQLVVDMIAYNHGRVFIEKDYTLEKCDRLYKIVVEQGGKMSDELRSSYLRLIHELIKESKTEFISLKDISKK